MPERRQHLSWKRCLTALPALLVLVPLFALMVVGSSQGQAGGFSVYGLEIYEPFEHGWPLTFLRRTVDLHGTSRWAIWNGRKEWDWTSAAGDAGIFLAVAVVVTAITVWRARQKRVWQLTLRGSLLVMLIVAMFAAHLGWCIRRGERALVARQRLESLGGSVGFEYCGPKWVDRLQSEWLERALQDAPLESVSWVKLQSIQRDNMEEAISVLAECDRPREVLFESTEINEPLFQLLLECLTSCQPEELSLGGLKLESFTGEPWSPELLEPLARNPRLRKIDLGDTSVGDAELAALLKCRQLRNINLRGTNVTPQGTISLLALPQLEELVVSQRAASEQLSRQAVAAGVRLDIVELLWSDPGSNMDGASANEKK